MKKIFFISLFSFLFAITVFAQDDVQIGSNLNNYRQTQGGLFDYSDPSGINIKLQLWGYVKYPGYYVIPSNSTLNDLLSFAGGPLEDAMMNDIRIYRQKETKDNKLTKYDLNDLLWNDSLSTEIVFPNLHAGDVVLVPGEPRYFLREDIAFYLSITTALASLAALIISITK
ncbi:MAG: SLBB domain-containing protein [Ignavibacteriota bacterium]